MKQSNKKDESLFAKIFDNEDSMFAKIFGPYHDTGDSIVQISLSKENLQKLQQGNKLNFKTKNAKIQIKFAD